MKKVNYLTFTMLILSLATISAAQEITAVTEQWPPYNYKENNEIKGISTEIVQAALSKAGIKAKIHVYTWARSYKMASEQENVLIYTILRNEKREKLFKWIGPIVPLAKMCLFRPSERTDIVVNSLEDAKKYRIGVAYNTSTHQLLLDKGFEKGKNLFPVPKQEQNIAKLLKGRLDLITDREITLAMGMKSLGKPFSKVEKVFILSEWDQGFYMAFSTKTSDKIVEQVKTAFDQVKAQGIPETVMEKYLNIYTTF